jgi:hypothetical protein
MQKDAH